MLFEVDEIIAQDSFYIIEDFGHIQAKANCIIEYDNCLYIGGSAIPHSDTTFRRDLLIAKYALNGTKISDLVFPHQIPLGVWNSTVDDGITVMDNDLIISHNLSGNIHEAITRVDTSLSDIEFIDTFSIAEDLAINVISHYLLDDNRLLFPLNNTRLRNLFGVYNLLNKSFSYQDITNENDVYSYLSRIFEYKEKLILLGGVQYINQEEKLTSDTKLIVLNKELEIEQEQYLSPGLGGAETRIHAVISEEQNQLVVTVEDKKDQKTRPVIYAVDLDNYELVWQEFHGDSTYKRRFDFPRSLIRTHDKLGYLTAGLKFADPDLGGPFIALLTKMDDVGKTIWQKSISDLHEGTGLEFSDILATSDGYYVACGSRSDVTEDDGYDSRVQLFMIKFDEDGNIVDRDAVSSTLEEDANNVQADIRVYPNPTSGILYIENLSGTPLSYQLVDDAGHRIRTLKQDVTTELSVLDLSGYPSGSYVLVGTDNMGEVVVSERVVVVR